MTAARKSNILSKALRNFLHAAVTLSSAHADHGQGSEEHQRCHRKAAGVWAWPLLGGEGNDFRIS